MLTFYVKVFRTSLFPNPLMDLVHVRCDDRYWSKILHSAIPTPIRHFKVKVTDLELLCRSFALKFLGPHCFQTLWWIWFMFGVMIDTGPKFYTVTSPPPYIRAATIHSPHDTVHIAILASQYDMYRDTLFRLEIISNCMRIILWSSPYFKVCLKWFTVICSIYL